MSDDRVADALKSDARLVVVEAPAGFGKTFQGANYVQHLIRNNKADSRVLVLTHTHAAREVFTSRTKGLGTGADARTIHSVVTEIAGRYHKALDLPQNVAAWAYKQGESGFDQLASKVATLLTAAPYVAHALATRYPYVICDEHQDATEAQHSVVMSLLNGGACLRVFGDPMQAIYTKQAERDGWKKRWGQLEDLAGGSQGLNVPHRWKSNAPELGDWIRTARSQLKAGNPIDLRGELPRGLSIFRGDNVSQRHDGYMLQPLERQPIDRFVKASDELLILAARNDTVRAIRALFNRAIPIWEGHTRNALTKLLVACHENSGGAIKIAEAFIDFLQSVLKGFSDTSYANLLLSEVKTGCTTKRRNKPALLQRLGKCLLDDPNHSGVARAIRYLQSLISNEQAFSDLAIDLRREFAEAGRIDEFPDSETAIVELNRRRVLTELVMPAKVVSTIHKAKGLEKRNVLLLACDKIHFGATDEKRCLLYVGLSRPIESLAIVLPKNNATPLFISD